MEISEKITGWTAALTEFLNEQPWFQQIKSKYEELDPQSRTYLKFAAFGSSILLVIIIILSFIWSVYSLKSELTEKRKLLSLIQVANDEMRQFQDIIPSAASGGKGTDKDSVPWSTYFELLTGNAGLDKSALTISSEKAGNSNDQTKEILFDLNLKHVNIKQVVRYAFFLENGQRPVKLRNLSIDTKGDSSGYLDATLSVSAFTLVVQQ